MADISWLLIWAGPNTGMGRGPMRMASATWVRLALRRLGTTLPFESMPPDPAAWWHWAQLMAKDAWPWDWVTQPVWGTTVGHWGITVGMVGPAGLPVMTGRALM